MSRSALRPLFTAVATAALFTTASAAAQGTGDVDEARKLFDAGVQAYSSGQFAAAIQAFEQAERIAPRPAVLFSLAQAQRKQYFVEKHPDLLRAALKNFRSYLKAVQEGGRRVEAAQAVGELELLETRLDGAAAARTAKDPARLMVLSRVPGTTASLDGGPPKAAPIAFAVTPGRHRVTLSAPGHTTEARDAVAVENAIVPVDVPLREKPATLIVAGPTGAAVAVDGKPVAELGRDAAPQVGAGIRFVTVAKNGYQPFAQEIELRRGEPYSMVAPLTPTRQRLVSYAFLGAFGAGAISAGVLAGFSFAQEGEATDLNRKRLHEGLTPGERSDYEAAVSRRDDYRTAALVAAGVGVGAGIVGAVLWIFDPPNPPTSPVRPVREAVPERDKESDVAIVPGPGHVGLGAVHRF